MSDPKTSKTQWDFFLEEQKALMEVSLSDPQHRMLAGLAVLGGVVSSVALARLYTRLTPDATDDHFYAVMPKAVFAVGTGLLGVVWYMNKAHAEREAIDALALTAEEQGEQEELQKLVDEGIISDDQASGLADAMESSIFDIIQHVT